MIIAHRGYTSRFPENTLASFQGAIESGATMIELDISLSKDRRVVVIHDETLERTTNGKGTVCDHTLDELKRLDAGSWFSTEFKKETIPTLEEVFKIACDKVMINIEIKPEAYEPNAPCDAIETRTLDLIRQYNCLDSVIISSFEPGILKRINSMTSHRPLTAYLSETPADENTVTFILTHNIYSWNPDWRILCKEQVELMHRNGIKVFTYTVNDKDVAAALFHMGVDGIFSDDPLLLKGL